MTQTQAKTILKMVSCFAKMDKSCLDDTVHHLDEVGWVMVNLHCSRAVAEKKIALAIHMTSTPASNQG